MVLKTAVVMGPPLLSLEGRILEKGKAEADLIIS